MIKKRKREPGIYVMAIFQGAMIGVIGFLVMGYIFSFFESTAHAPGDETVIASGDVKPGEGDENQNSGAQTPNEVSKTYYTVQYGVFSTEDAAKQYLNQLALPTAQLVQLDNYLFIWDGLSEQRESLQKTVDVQSFTKQINVSASGCKKGVELLVSHAAKLDDQNFILEQINAAKLENEEMKLFQTWLGDFSVTSSKPLAALNQVLAKESCVSIELE
ncbi:hypothetical protein ACFO0S_13215 [Chryseomicrobium palamuruense]|uniref:SPOR domain-containing protein n=1 Tax=Chryseomicrobium palamuruense TaxID=682973 RepID=A0ABV8UXG9_9BACL